MVDETATGGEAAFGGSGWFLGPTEHSLGSLDPSTDASVVLSSLLYGSMIGRSVTPSALVLGFEEKMDALSREMRLVRLLIHSISQQQDVQLHEIRQLSDLVHGLSQQLESSNDSDPELEIDGLDLDYQTMETLANVEPRPSVNWKGVSKITPYAEMFNIQYELDSEET